MGTVSNLLNVIFSWLTEEGLFAVCFCTLTVAFVINLILSLTLGGYVKKKRLWYYFSSPFVLLLQSTLTLSAGGNFSLVVLNLVAALVYLFASLLIKDKKTVADDNRFSFARTLNERVKEDAPEILDGEKMLSNYQANKKVPHDELVMEEGELEPLRPSQVEELIKGKTAADYGLDFSHVKNVLSRLDYFSLSPADKRQVKELEATLVLAEQGDFSDVVKDRVNDGLGSLLKIMSKYGV